MAIQLDLSSDRTCDEVLRLQRASYAVESVLIGYRIPALCDSPESLRLSGDTFLGYEEDGSDGRSLLGVISFQRRGGTIEINRLVVRPDHFQQGVATALLMSLEERHYDAEIIHVETASANTPAVQLYKKLGYGEVSRREVPGGLLISQFRKNLL